MKSHVSANNFLTVPLTQAEHDQKQALLQGNEITAVIAIQSAFRGRKARKITEQYMRAHIDSLKLKPKQRSKVSNKKKQQTVGELDIQSQSTPNLHSNQFELAQNQAISKEKSLRRKKIAKVHRETRKLFTKLPDISDKCRTTHHKSSKRGNIAENHHSNAKDQSSASIPISEDSSSRFHDLARDPIEDTKLGDTMRNFANNTGIKSPSLVVDNFALTTEFETGMLPTNSNKSATFEYDSSVRTTLKKKIHKAKFPNLKSNAEFLKRGRKRVRDNESCDSNTHERHARRKKRNHRKNSYRNKKQSQARFRPYMLQHWQRVDKFKYNSKERQNMKTSHEKNIGNDTISLYSYLYPRTYNLKSYQNTAKIHKKIETSKRLKAQSPEERERYKQRAWYVKQIANANHEFDYMEDTERLVDSVMQDTISKWEYLTTHCSAHHLFEIEKLQDASNVRSFVGGKLSKNQLPASLAAKLATQTEFHNKNACISTKHNTKPEVVSFNVIAKPPKESTSNKIRNSIIRTQEYQPIKFLPRTSEIDRLALELELFKVNQTDSNSSNG